METGRRKLKFLKGMNYVYVPGLTEVNSNGMTFTEGRGWLWNRDISLSREGDRQFIGRQTS